MLSRMPSSRRTRPCPASATVHRSGPGCCGSWPTRAATGDARPSAGSGLAERAAGALPRGTAAESPESLVLAAETRTTLLAALGRLRDEDREVIGARYLLDLSEAETAETLGLRPGTVKSRTSRALGRLRVVLAELESGRTDG